MSPFIPIKRISTHRALLRVILFAGIAVVAGWTTFTSYSAKLDKASGHSNQSPDASRVSPKRARDGGRANLNKDYGKLPLSFEANRGQTDTSISYIARGPGYNILLSPSEAVLVFRNHTKVATKSGVENDQAAESTWSADRRHRQIELRQGRGEDGSNALSNSTIVRMKLEGGNQRALQGLDELPGKANYFIGNDPSKWRTNVPTYGRAAYNDVYPGIDLVYYGNGGQLEYDLVVSPGADPSLIKLKFDGPSSVRVDKKGDLLLKTSAGEIRQAEPLVYQEINGTRKKVEGHYVVRQGNRVGFKVSPYDQQRPLVIDPRLIYSSLVNGSGDGYTIAVDGNGFAYIAGTISDNMLNPTPGAFQGSLAGAPDAFVTKINAVGTEVLYTTYLGGPDYDEAYGIAVDSQGNAYVTGVAGVNFPTTAGALQTTNGGLSDSFVTKLNPSGNGLVYSTFYGGNGNDEGDGIVVDAAGNATVGGSSGSTNLVTSPGAFQTAPGGELDCFALKLNSAGSALIYATYFGGSGREFVNATIAEDSSGNAYISGQTSSFDFPQVNSLMGPGGMDRGLFKSSNAASSWTLSRNGLQSGFVFSLAIDRNSSTTLFAGVFKGVVKSTDGGLNWASTGASRPRVQALAIDPTNSSIIYAGTGVGVDKSTNAGGVWSSTSTGSEIRALAIDPTTPATVYAGAFGDGVLKSTNAGGSWAPANVGLTNTAVRGLVIDPTTPATLYAAAGQRVFKTTNGAGSWTLSSTGLPASQIFCLAIDPSSPSTLYAGTGSGIYKTSNGGGIWAAANTNLLVPYTDSVSRLAGISAISVGNPSTTLYAAENNGATAAGAFPLSTIFKSTDGGANWTATTTGFGSLNSSFASLAIDPNNSSNIYAGNNGDFDAFMVKVNATGSALLNSTYLSSGRNDFAAGVAIDSSNAPYILGSTQGANFPTTPGAFQSVLKGNFDAFVTRLNSGGTALVYSTYLGGSLSDLTVGGIAVDSGGNAYITGSTASSDFPTTPGSFQTALGSRGTANGTDAFITKLNPAGTAPVYSSYLGGGGNEPGSNFFASRLALGTGGSVYLVGSTTDSPIFPFFDTTNGFGRTYVAKIDESIASFSITGKLTTGTNAPIAGVTVDATNSQGLRRSATSDSQGFYSLVSLPPGDYTITPGRLGFTAHYLFAPASRTFNGLNSDQTADFTGTQVYDIFGQVTSSTVPGLGLFDVTLTLTGSASASVISDASGNYTFPDLAPGNYTVTPSKPGFAFNPVNQSFTNISSDQVAGFTSASATFFTVSGHIADATNAPVSNVLITTTVKPQVGSRLISTQTNANGDYSLPNLQSGGNYTFIPVKPVLSFTPQRPTITNLSGDQTINFAAATVTGLIGQLAFSKFDVSTQGIFVMNADGTGEAERTNSIDESPAWSPDGAKIAFSRQDLGAPSDIYTMNADGTGLTRLTNAQFEDVFPSWSPDGTKLTFTYGQCDGPDLVTPDVFVMDSTGANRVLLTKNLLVNGFSDWSPGGSTIAFARGPSGDCNSAEETADIFAMDPDGSNQRSLTNNPDGESRPTYSPDGSRIAYFRGSPQSPAHLYVMNSDGSGQTQIGPDVDLDHNNNSKPSWSPDGSKIVFSATLAGSSGPSQIFVINADGTGFAQITNDTAFRFDVSWRHYSISGRVTGNTTGLPITMTLAGTLTRVTQTDANGNYVFGNLTPGGNYSVTPVSTAFGFNPIKTDIANLVGNQVANFAILPAVVPTPTPPLADDFGGAQRDPAKWNLGTQTLPLGAFDPAVSVVQQNGRLVITPRTNAADLHYNGYVAVNSFDFNNGTATVEVPQAATGGADTIFAIGSDLDNFSRFVVRDGPGQPGVFMPGPNEGRGATVAQLIFQVRVGGQLTSVSIPYDPVLHRFMRFRHQPANNSIAFETSPDNVNFTVRHEVVLQKSVSALTAELSAGTSTAANPGVAMFDNFNLVTNTIQFAAASLSVNEDQGSGLLSVTRSGDISTPAAVDYLSFDDSAHQSSKYIIATGSLSFAPGETTKSIRVLIIDNVFVEGNQTLFLNLVDSFGGGLNAPGRTALTIVDNDTTPPTSNPLDNSDALFFVREHYYDFLSREPDPGGLAFWANEITSCGTDQSCREYKRVNVSAAFFLSIEFQDTGYLVHRFYNASLDRANGLPRYLEFLRDTQTIGRGVVVGAPGWEAQLEANKVAYADKFVLRPEFKVLYPLTLTPTEYVDALYAHAQIIPSAAERQAAIDEFNTPTGARGRALRRVVENQALYAREFNRAFVLAQYFGYLRRNPDDPPDNDLAGFNFWLTKLNQFNGNYIAAEMVKAFIVSGEYRGRFGP